MIEGVGQPKRLMLLQVPARMETSDIVRKVACKEAVLSILDFLLQALAIINPGRCFGKDAWWREKENLQY